MPQPLDGSAWRHPLPYERCVHDICTNHSCWPLIVREPRVNCAVIVRMLRSQALDDGGIIPRRNSLESQAKSRQGSRFRRPQVMAIRTFSSDSAYLDAWTVYERKNIERPRQMVSTSGDQHRGPMPGNRKMHFGEHGVADGVSGRDFRNDVGRRDSKLIDGVPAHCLGNADVAIISVCPAAGDHHARATLLDHASCTVNPRPRLGIQVAPAVHQIRKYYHGIMRHGVKTKAFESESTNIVQ
jgi:hypothetical protein